MLKYGLRFRPKNGQQMCTWMSLSSCDSRRMIPWRRQYNDFFRNMKLGSRNFAAQVQQVYSWSNLNRATDYFLNPHQSPLGTLDGQAWQDIELIMKAWQGNGLSGFSLGSIDKLLQRLVYEQATINPNNPRKMEQDLIIADWRLAILDGWIQLSQKQHEPGIICAAAERAELTLADVVEWYNQGGYQTPLPADRDPLPVPHFVLLVREWLRSGSPAGTIRAAELLLTWTDGEHAAALLVNNQDDLVSCFNETLKQFTDMLHNKEDLALGDISKTLTSVVSRMDLLRESGWKGLDEVSDLSRKIVLLETFKASSGDRAEEAHRSKSFEEEAIYKRMVELISTAEESDLETIIQDVIPRFKAAEGISVGIARDIVVALVDFFMRIKDPRHANYWLQRFDHMVMASPSKDELMVLVDRLKALLGLWAETAVHDQEAVWRADEIQKRLENLQKESEKSNISAVGTDTYLAMFQAWSRHNTNPNIAAQKKRELFHKFHEAHTDTELSDIQTILEEMADDMDAVVKPTEDQMDFLIKIVQNKWNGASETKREMAAAALIKALDNYDMNDKAINFVTGFILTQQDPEKRKTLQSTFLCERILRSCLSGMATESRLVLIEESGGYLEGPDSFWTLGCYEAALSALFRNVLDNNAYAAAAKKLLNIALDRLVSGTLTDDEDSVNLFLMNVLEGCFAVSSKNEVAEKSDLAAEILLLAENKLLSLDPEHPIRTRFPLSPISITVYNRVMTKLYFAKKAAKGEGTFLRMLDYYETGGYKDLLPDKTSLERYMDNVIVSDRETPSEKGERMETMLFKWIEMYQSKEPKEVVKLGGKETELILGCYKRERTEQGVIAALNFLDRVLSFFWSGEIEQRDASFWLQWTTRLVERNASEASRYHLMVERLLLKYVFDKRYKLTLSEAGWARVMRACCVSKRKKNHEAVQVAIMALAQCRSAHRISEEIYGLFLESIRHNASQGGHRRLVPEIASTGFESCCEDGLLTPALVKQFQLLMTQDQWSALYTAQLTDDGKVPKEWSRNILREEKQKKGIYTQQNMEHQQDRKKTQAGIQDDNLIVS